jgi:hypothetical protein
MMICLGYGYDGNIHKDNNDNNNNEKITIIMMT